MRDRHRHRPPEWWPEGESWTPGRGGPSWTGLRRRFVRAVAVAVFVLLVVPLVIALALTATVGGWAAVGVVLVFWLALLAVGLVIGRVAFRSFGPVRGLVDVTDRLADGDYSARVDPSRSTPMQPVVESVNTMAERLERSEELRTRLLADVGHELRTPLTVIRGGLEAMADGVRPVDPDGVRSLLGDVEVMERLLTDLQTLSAAEAGRLRLHQEPVDLSKLVGDVVDGMRTLTGDRTLEVTSSSAIEFDVDPIRIREVVANLLTNALRATEDGGVIAIDITQEAPIPDAEAWAVVRVIDDGTGMSAEDLEHAFDRFHKGATSRGSGLGLAISRDLVEAHGGTIGIESREHEGTTVTLRLPLG